MELVVEQPHIESVTWFGDSSVRVRIFDRSVTLPAFWLENIDVWVHELTEAYLWGIPSVICPACFGEGCSVCDNDGRVTLRIPVQLCNGEWATIAHILTSLCCVSGNIKNYKDCLTPDKYSKLVMWREKK